MRASEAGILLGRLRGENRYEPLPGGRIRVRKRVEVHRPFGPLFHLICEKEGACRHAQELRRLEAEGGGVADPGSRGESASPFGINEPAATPNHAVP
jgi:hypothetical protein